MIQWPVNSAKRSIEHPRGWKWVPLVDVATLVTGHPPARNVPEYWGGGISWINLTEIRTLNGSKCEETELQISAAGVAKSSAVVHPAGTVCMSRTASVGFVTKMGVPMATSQDFVNWIPGPEIDSDYLMKALTASRPRILTLCSGSTHKTMYVRDAERLSILLPPIEEQRRIATVLDAADALRAQSRQAITKLDTLTQAIFIDMFGDPLTNPKGWADGRVLSDVADARSGITKGRKTGDAPLTPVPYLAVVNVQDGFIEMEPLKSIDATATEIERFRLIDGDILLTEGGDPDKLGRGAVWTAPVESCIHQNHVFRVRVTDDAMTAQFLSRLLGSSRGKRYFLRMAKQTTGIASINMTQLRAFPILEPPLRLQEEYLLRIAKLNQLREVSLRLESGFDTLFVSLQQRAFRGEL